MSDDERQYTTKRVFMWDIKHACDALRRATCEMCQGFSLQTEAEWLGGFGTTMLNLETGELWISEGAYRIDGLRRLSAVSTKSDVELSADLVHPDDAEAVQARRAIAVEAGAEHRCVFRIIRPDGAVRHIRATGKRIDAAHGHPAVLLAAVVDETPTT